MACWAFSNHDVQRHVTRWGLTNAGTRLYATLISCLRGSVCLYQGEELGLTEADVAYEDLQDPYGIEFWPEFKGRDGCRTPMVWEPSNKNGGFTTAHPWLPVAPEHLGHAASKQDNEPDSLLNHYRAVIAMRAGSEALRLGEQTAMQVDGDVLTFERSQNSERIFCAFNMGDRPASVALPAGNWSEIEGIGATAPGAGGLALNGWGVSVLRAV